MALSTTTRPEARPAGPARGTGSSVDRPSRVAGLLTAVWLVIVGAPLLLMVIWSLTERRAYQRNGPLALPDGIAWENIAQVFDARFGTYMLNTFAVTAGSIALTLLLALPAAYAIVRSRSWAASLAFRAFLLGLAIPAQAVIVPVYLIITRLELYDTLRAVILPTVAFNLPLVVLILSGSLRDVSRELYEAMTMDGAGPFLMARGEVDAVVVGADRICANGDTVNKIGTYAHALGAQRAGVPFVVVAPESTIDAETPDGSAVLIEDRASTEVNDGFPAANPAFDVTPHDLIDAIVTDKRTIRPAAGERPDA